MSASEVIEMDGGRWNVETTRQEQSKTEQAAGQASENRSSRCRELQVTKSVRKEKLNLRWQVA
jgi:hypothetical protein